MTEGEAIQEIALIKQEIAELNRTLDVLTAQKDLLQSELNLLCLIDESKDGSKSQLIMDVKLRIKTFVVKHLMDILYKHLSYKTDEKGMPIHILDMSFVEYVNFLFLA